MSKIRQALDYEQRLAKQRDESSDEILRQAIEYERKLTDQQFKEVSATQIDHQRFHDREHILYDDAVEKAAAALRSDIATLESEVDRLREASAAYMTVDRFEREHANLTQRFESSTALVTDRIEREANVTARQEAQASLLERLSSNNRWLIGLSIASAFSLITLLAHFFKLI